MEGPFEPTCRDCAMYFSIPVCMTTYPPTEGLEAAARPHTAAEVRKVPSPESGDFLSEQWEKHRFGWGEIAPPIFTVFSDFVLFHVFFWFLGQGIESVRLQHGIFFTSNRNERFFCGPNRI